MSTRIRRLRPWLWLALSPLAGLAQPELGGEPEAALDTERPPRYRVEVIVFAHAQVDPSEEYLPVTPHRSRFNLKRNMPVRRYVDAAMLRSIEAQVDGPIADERAAGVLPPFSDDLLAIDHFLPEITDLGLRILDPSELQLQREYATLTRSSAYTPIAHTGWEQIGLSEIDAVELDMSLLGISNPVGAIRLHVSRFLHTRVDLAYRPPFAANPAPLLPGSPAPVGGVDPFVPRPLAPAVYYLYEERRVFRGEINYLDHPAFGVILLVTLAPEPVPEPTVPAIGISPSA